MYNHSHQENHHQGDDDFARLSVPTPISRGRAQRIEPEVREALESRGFEIVRVLGEGGFGKTYHVSRDGKEYAVKQLTAEGDLPRELFDREADILGRLSYPGRPHPQIPVFYGQFEDGDHSYIVQEFIRGQNLQEAVREHGAFDEGQVRHVLKETLRVLDFMHGHNVRSSGDVGFLHRDIKPANIMVKDDGTIVLVDFGVARDGISSLAGTRVGTPGYVAPEQANGRALPASDIYGLGVTAAMLLAGSDRFLVHSEPQQWRIYATHPVSDSLAQVIDTMIAPVVSSRFHSAKEVLAALDGRGSQTLSGPTQVISHPAAHSYPAPEKQRGTNVPLWGALFAAAAVITSQYISPKTPGPIVSDPSQPTDVGRSNPGPSPSPSTSQKASTVAPEVTESRPESSQDRSRPRNSGTGRPRNNSAKKTEQQEARTEQKNTGSQQGTKGTEAPSEQETKGSEGQTNSRQTDQSAVPTEQNNPSSPSTSSPSPSPSPTPPPKKGEEPLNAGITDVHNGSSPNGNVSVGTVPQQGVVVLTTEEVQKVVELRRAQHEGLLTRAYVDLKEEIDAAVTKGKALTGEDLKTHLDGAREAIGTNLKQRAADLRDLQDSDQAAVQQYLLDKNMDAKQCPALFNIPVTKMQEEVVQKGFALGELNLSPFSESDRGMVESFYHQVVHEQREAFAATLKRGRWNC